jgi:hypothetical protein
MLWILPFHAAEQRNKERRKASAERSDFPKLPFFMSSTGGYADSVTSERLPFLLSAYKTADVMGEPNITIPSTTLKFKLPTILVRFLAP